ncbi:hypothetical protein PO909_023930 [Leuciscus waleckii]
MRLPSLWVLSNPRPFLCSMPSLAVTQSLHLQPGAKRQHGIPGMQMTWQQRPSWLFQRLQKAFQKNFHCGAFHNSPTIAPAANSTSIKLVLSSQRKEGGMEQIPPTKDAKVQHLKRAVYQGGHCWGQTFEEAPNMPFPTDWGWIDPSDWRPLWSTLPQASQSILELLNCGCKKGCRVHSSMSMWSLCCCIWYHCNP